MHSGSFKDVIYELFVYNSYVICIHKEDLALNTQQGLICRKDRVTY